MEVFSFPQGEMLPEEKRFDSNCITPGTEFMSRLQDQLQYFITKKISTDPLWRRVRVILSGHQVILHRTVLDKLFYESFLANF